MPTLTRRRWPVIARRAESDSVLGMLGDGSRGVLIYGEAGVGKSTLADTVLTELSNRPRAPQVIRLRADAAVTSTPWTVFAPLLSPIAQESASLEHTLAQVREGLPTTDPVLLYVDDAHLLDEPSATVLAELLQSATVTMLATTRLQPGPARPLTALWREGVLDRLDLKPLGHGAVAELLSQTLGGPVAQETTKRIWNATNGNPLFLRELVLALIESDALQKIEGAWIWYRAGPQSQRLTDLVSHELAGLDEQAREVIDLIALAGTIPVSRISDAVSDDALDTVVRNGLLVLEQDEHTGVSLVRITHPVYAETVRSLIYPQRRHALFHRLSAPTQQSPHLADLFHWVSWALQCGIEPEPEYLLAATRAAAAVQSTALVIQMATEALRRFEDPAVAAEIVLLRAEAHRFDGTTQRAQHDLELAGRYLQRVDAGSAHDHLWVRMAEVTADLQQYHQDDLDAALTTLTQAREQAPLAEEHARNRLSIARLTRLGYAGRFTECVGPIRQWLSGEVAHHPASIQLVPVLALGYAQQGQLSEAVRICDQVLTSWSPHLNAFPWVHGEILSARYLAMLWLGDLEQATQPPGGARDPLWRYDEAVSQTGTGRYYAALGQWSRSVREYRGALSRFAVRDPSGLAGVAWTGLAQAYAALGADDDARAARAQYLTRAAGTTRVIESDCRYGLALVATALGEADAHEQALELTRWCAARELHLGVLRGQHLALYTALEQDRAALLPELIEAAGRVDGAVPGALVHHARAMIDHDDEVAAFRVKELAELGVWIPAPPPQVRLTPRQHEIANLVLLGLSNREIAERLVLSVRTVDTHVGHIFTRLSVRNRADLATVMARSARPQ